MHVVSSVKAMPLSSEGLRLSMRELDHAIVVMQIRTEELQMVSRSIEHESQKQTLAKR